MKGAARRGKNGWTVQVMDPEAGIQINEMKNR